MMDGLYFSLFVVFLVSVLGYWCASKSFAKFDALLEDVKETEPRPQWVNGGEMSRRERDAKSLRLYMLWRRNLKLESQRSYLMQRACEILMVNHDEDSPALDWIKDTFLGSRNGGDLKKLVGRFAEVPMDSHNKDELRRLWLCKVSTDDQRLAVFDEACGIYGVDQCKDYVECDYVAECFFDCSRTVTPGMIQIKIDEHRREWSVG